MHTRQLRIFCFLFAVVLLPLSHGIGVLVPPLKKNQIPSLDNLQQCISYELGAKDVLFLTIKSIEHLPSQDLNLLVLDNLGNKLRDQQKLERFSDPIELIINPQGVTYEGDASSAAKLQDRDLDPTKFVHICFYNTFHDLSWSFKPRTFELEMSVNIKDDIKKTDYQMYRQFFAYLDGVLTEGEFDNKMNMVSLDLNNIIDKLHSSNDVVKELLDQEFKLRDTNEEIFSGYTFISIVLCATIFVCGVIQLLWFKLYLGRVVK
ncbi:hypothetical protein KGF57_002096 [Candida theae]|uniref:GOLD domain-containing protein n=1 Tax=Candida theae TaxID=1198502 RepID=A0AAD5FZ33_9ASCO|nr:uncharacterized protein KGF57_002096 [Candida theae]KAI5959458.1 hypothetical protein KGF57_002096 [Candida theae]